MRDHLNKLTALADKLVVGYIRCSSQLQVRDGDTLERQTERIVAYCKAKGLSEPLIIRDEGISGFKENRAGFKQLVALCKAGKVSTLVVNDLSRLSRSLRTTLGFVEDIVNKQGISFISLQMDIDTQTPHGKMFLAVVSMFAQHFRDDIGWKTKSAIGHKKSKGEKYSGIVPYGFKEASEGFLVKCDEDIRLMHKIRELKAEGFSLRGIAKELEQQGCLTKTGKAHWSPKVINDLLTRGVVTDG